MTVTMSATSSGVNRIVYRWTVFSLSACHATVITTWPVCLSQSTVLPCWCPIANRLSPATTLVPWLRDRPTREIFMTSSSNPCYQSTVWSSPITNNATGVMPEHRCSSSVLNSRPHRRSAGCQSTSPTHSARGYRGNRYFPGGFPPAPRGNSRQGQQSLFCPSVTHFHRNTT